MGKVPRWVRAVDMGYDAHNVPRIVMESMVKKRDETVRFNIWHLSGSQLWRDDWGGRGRVARTRAEEISISDHYDNEAPLVGTEIWMERQLHMERDIAEGKYEWEDTSGNEPVKSNLESICFYLYLTRIRAKDMSYDVEARKAQILNAQGPAQANWAEWRPLDKRSLPITRWRAVCERP